MNDLKKLAKEAQAFSVLFAEDNTKLRNNVAKLLNKFFSNVDIAENGKTALELFKKNSYDIVITDIIMPEMNGMELAKYIKDLNTHAKVIIMSAFDDREYLMNSIELKVFRFLKKPVGIYEFADVINDAITELKEEQNANVFNTNLKNVFNYQSSIVLMLKDFKPIMANQMFLDFFGVDDLENFFQKHKDLGNVFLKHDGFLYQTEDKNWFDEIRENTKEMHNVKLFDKNKKFKHFILKYTEIPDQESYGILSFDDVTDLKLLDLYDASQIDNQENLENEKAMFDLLNILHRNYATVEVHNYYKGLSITNDGTITEINDKKITLKTKFSQIRAIQYEKKTILVSDSLPYAIEAKSVERISYDKQEVVLSDLKFIQTSAVDRKTVRIVPDEKQSISLFLGENKFHTDITIDDISLEAIKLSMYTIPAGLEEGDEVWLNIVLEFDKKPFIINTSAKLLHKDARKNDYHLIFAFEDLNKSELTKYITKRQMAIIREFKGIKDE
ncbi:response regulator transcription factor [Sulfurimonas sp.]|uniref:response regulator transcription factor n=1 Tax=Sulfurimonas sp. TaxID=2022749 RepID=UPI003568C6C4